jgi:leucine efflux protein
MLSELGVVNLWTYVIGAIFIILVPGPNTIFVLTTSVRKGIKNGYQAAFGVFLGDAILMFCAFIGVASLIQASPMLFTVIKYAGASYLFYLGTKILYANFVKKESLNQEEIKLTKESSFKKAVLLSVTNPKAILFFVSFFVQFVDPSYANPAVPFLILAGILELCSFIYLSLLIVCGATLSMMFREKKSLAKLCNSLVGSLFVGFGVKLMATAG